MNLDSILNIFSAIVTVALVTTILASPNTASVLRAVGETFANSLRAAMGRA